MSQEESVLINIENQHTAVEQLGMKMKTQQSSGSCGRNKRFSPPNADNLTQKIRLNQRQVQTRPESDATFGAEAETKLIGPKSIDDGGPGEQFGSYYYT